MNHIELTNKFNKAMRILKSNVQYVVNHKTPETEEEFNSNVEWVTGKTANNTAITTTTNPHSEITWTLVKAEMDRLDAEYDAQEYARKRKAEYPSVQDLVVALYDTDDKAAIDEKRAEIKLKYPKPGA